MDTNKVGIADSPWTRRAPGHVNGCHASFHLEILAFDHFHVWICGTASYPFDPRL